MVFDGRYISKHCCKYHLYKTCIWKPLTFFLVLFFKFNSEIIFQKLEKKKLVHIPPHTETFFCWLWHPQWQLDYQISFRALCTPCRFPDIDLLVKYPEHICISPWPYHAKTKSKKLNVKFFKKKMSEIIFDINDSFLHFSFYLLCLTIKR